MFLSVIALAELRHGIERMAQSARRGRLDEWLRQELPRRFEKRILPLSEVVADAWGKLMAQSEAAGRPIDAMDAFIAATVNAHDLTLVTRNTGDFKAWVKAIVNPWTEK